MALSDALRDAKAWAFVRPATVGVYRGVRYRGGQRTAEECIVVAVKKKQPLSEIAASDMVPLSFGGVATDVVQTGAIEILTLRKRDVSTSSLTQRRRPCEGGYSIGHGQVTAGTLGMWAKRAGSDDWVVVSNNHVLANSNDAVRGDFARQPGKADGGRSPDDHFARLVDYVPIRFEKSTKKGGVSGAVSRAWWASGRAVTAAGAKMTGCDYRLPQPELPASVVMAAQAEANRLDLAIALPISQSLANPVIYRIGAVAGTRDAALGMGCQKSGRTTEHQLGIVDGVDGAFRVSYGSGRTAVFEGQVVIRHRTGGEFSAGGDSGSIICDDDRHAIGLLFAGGDGMTIANPISDVMASFGGLRVG